jgi:hypothetical protein
MGTWPVIRAHFLPTLVKVRIVCIVGCNLNSMLWLGDVHKLIGGISSLEESCMDFHRYANV